jgi:hypothetical protein
MIHQEESGHLKPSPDASDLTAKLVPVVMSFRLRML